MKNFLKLLFKNALFVAFVCSCIISGLLIITIHYLKYRFNFALYFFIIIIFGLVYGVIRSTFIELNKEDILKNKLLPRSIYKKILLVIGNEYLCFFLQTLGSIVYVYNVHFFHGDIYSSLLLFFIFSFFFSLFENLNEKINGAVSFI